MGKEILYRRSFHCDRDLKSVKDIFELEKSVESKKANADGKMLADGGFEAPRNSLDVPVSTFPQRRPSEVRCEDIPIGYELSRSLTTRRRSEDRRNEDRLGRKSMSSADSFLLKPKFMNLGNPEGDQKSRSSSVVARLMGLDPLPLHQGGVQALQSSNHPSSRRLLPHDFLVPQSGSCSTDNQAGISRVPSQRGTRFTAEIIPEKPRSYEDLPFRSHPQEKQLQDFKREFAVRQRKQSPVPCSKADMLDMHGKVLPNEQQGSGRETLQESQEFLDALDFLHSNKEFFVKMLKDPSVLFTKNIEHPGRTASSLHKEGSGQKGKKLTRSSSESRKESYICLPGIHDSTDSRRKHEMNRYESDHKAQNVCIPHFGQDEHMPLQPHPHAPSVSPPLKTVYDQTMPTKIVVLKPKVGKHSGNRSCSPSSPFLHLDASFTARVDGKESVKHDIKERPMGRKEQAAAKEPHTSLSKDALKDAGDIAKQILKQVKEDMSRRLPSESFQSLESASLARSSSKGKRSPATEKLGMFVDAAGASDGEGSYSSSRRIMKDNVKAQVSLPSSPRLSRADSENDYRAFIGNGRRGVSGEKSSRGSTFANNARDTRKDHMGAGSITDDAGKKQEGIRDVKSPIKTRMGGGKDGKGASESSRVLPRSLLAPPASAATIKNRASDKDQKHRSSVNRAARVKSAKTAETSLFKEKLLSLKDSFSLSKKGSSKRQATNSPSETSELSSPRQLTEEHKCITGVDAQQSGITVFPAYPWQTACLRQDDQDKAVMDGCLDYLISVNSAESNARQQWTSTTGDIFDSASDVSLEKCEQPSPISVLDTPFQEESPSPEQTNSECHHEASLKFSPLDSDDEKRLLNLHDGLLSASASWQSSFNSTAEEALLPGANAPLETLSLGDIACPLGSEKELVYIRDLLAFAGFTNNQLISRAHTFSVEHGLDPSNFVGLESHYEKMSQRNTSSRHNAYSTPLNTLSRRMLYDVVDEILSRKLIEPTFQLGPRQAKPFVQYLYTGKQLLEQVWAHISYFRYVPCESEEDSLDNLAARELMKDVGWSQPPSDMQVVIRELERSICGDLIRDVVRECVRV